MISWPTGLKSDFYDIDKKTMSFIPYAEGDYIFELIISDGIIDSNVDTVTISVDGPNSLLRRTNDENWSKWNALGISNYQIQTSHTLGHYESATIYINSIITENETPLSYYPQYNVGFGFTGDHSSFVLTIDELFNKIEQSIGISDVLRVEYDEKYGYPKSVILDENLQLGADQSYIRVDSFTSLEAKDCNKVNNEVFSLSIVSV